MLQIIANFLGIISFVPAIYSSLFSNEDMVLSTWIGYTIIMTAQIVVLKRTHRPYIFFGFMLLGDIIVVLSIIFGGMNTIGLYELNQVILFTLLLILALFGYLVKSNNFLSQLSLIVAIFIVVYPGIIYYWNADIVSVSTSVANALAIFAISIQLFLELRKKHKWLWNSFMTIEWLVLGVLLEILMITGGTKTKKSFPNFGKLFFL